MENHLLFSLPLFPPLGHLLGLSHDDSKFCEENFGSTEDKRLMSSILTSIDASKPWSKCTSATITEFLDDGHGMCHSGQHGTRNKNWEFMSVPLHLILHMTSSSDTQCCFDTLREQSKHTDRLLARKASILGGIVAMVFLLWN